MGKYEEVSTNELCCCWGGGEGGGGRLNKDFFVDEYVYGVQFVVTSEICPPKLVS
jgi:hypothetical protein